jgi:hypothetical protein
MRENCTSGIAPGAPGNRRSYGGGVSCLRSSGIILAWGLHVVKRADAFCCALALSLTACTHESSGSCLPNQEAPSACRYKQGDAWCAKSEHGKPYAYLDTCVKEIESKDSVIGSLRADNERLRQEIERLQNKHESATGVTSPATTDIPKEPPRESHVSLSCSSGMIRTELSIDYLARKAVWHWLHDATEDFYFEISRNDKNTIEMFDKIHFAECMQLRKSTTCVEDNTYLLDKRYLSLRQSSWSGPFPCIETHSAQIP